MTERERLAELIAKARLKAKDTIGSMNNFDEWLADYLLEHGITLSDEEVIVNIDHDAIGQAVWDKWVSFVKPWGGS